MSKPIRSQVQTGTRTDLEQPYREPLVAGEHLGEDASGGDVGRHPLEHVAIHRRSQRSTRPRLHPQGVHR
jgi:hypothetical protein